MTPGHAILLLWGAFALSWLAAATWSARTEKEVGTRRELGYRVVLALGLIVFAIPAHRLEGALRLWHVHRAGAWSCVAIIALGFAFCWWARVHLGRLWSGRVTRKADHRVVDSGPYAVVRHPIYTGLLVATLGTMAAKGTIPGVAGALLVFVGLWMKARIEERWLEQELGVEAYGAYRRRVPMLVPFVPPSRPHSKPTER